MPGSNAQRQRLDFGSCDLLCKADQQGARANVVDGLAGNGLLLDGDSQVEAELEQQLE